MNKSLYKAKRSPEFEELFMDKELGFSKVRISFNKDFLPTKIDYFYKGQKGFSGTPNDCIPILMKMTQIFEKYLNSYLEYLKEWNKRIWKQKEKKRNPKMNKKFFIKISNSSFSQIDLPIFRRFLFYTRVIKKQT